MRKIFMILIIVLIANWIILQGRSSGSDLFERRYAICIGVGDYQDPKIIDRHGCYSAIKRISEILATKGLFDRVFLFTDRAPKDDPYYASKKNITSIIDMVLKEAKPKDTLLILFIGQGITTSSGKGFLLVGDSRLKSLSRTAISLDWLTDTIKKSGILKSILILDAQERKIIKKRVARGIYPDRYIDRKFPAIFYGAQKGSFNHPIEYKTYDLFMDTLIKGIDGYADSMYGGNNDGVVTLSELAEYLKDEMARLSIKTGAYQLPHSSIKYPLMGSVLISSLKAGGHRAQIMGPGMVKKMPKGIMEAELKKETVKKKVVKRFHEKRELKPELKEKPETIKKAPEKEPLKKKEVLIPPPVKKAETVKEIKKETVKETSRPAPEKRAPKITHIKKKVPEKIEKSEKEEKIELKEKEEKKTEYVQSREQEIMVSKKMIPEEMPPSVMEVLPTKTEKPQPVKPEKEEGPKKKAYKVGMIEEARKEPRVVPPPEPVLLRNTPQDITPKGIRSLLIKHNFYATCWTYNADFCNPEGEFFNRFIDNKNGTITDLSTNLMWQKGGSKEPMTWYDASEYVKKINEQKFGGYSDWRLPTVEELASLLESSWKNYDLFIDPVFERKQRHCWSADTYGIKRAWKVNYHMGFIIDFPMSDKNWVRLVRTIKKP